MTVFVFFSFFQYIQDVVPLSVRIHQNPLDSIHQSLHTRFSTGHFCLATFEIFSVSLVLSQVIIMCLTFVFCFFYYLCEVSLIFLDLWVIDFIKFGYTRPLFLEIFPTLCLHPGNSVLLKFGCFTDALLIPFWSLFSLFHFRQFLLLCSSVP